MEDINNIEAVKSIVVKIYYTDGGLIYCGCNNNMPEVIEERNLIWLLVSAMRDILSENDLANSPTT
jgi:hypothetical protein